MAVACARDRRRPGGAQAAFEANGDGRPIAYVEYVDLLHDYEGKSFDRLEKSEPFSWLLDDQTYDNVVLPKESAIEILEKQLREPASY